MPGKQDAVALDIFCGAGGAALGAIAAGFQVVGGVDIDRAAARSFKLNLRAEPLVVDLRSISGKDILRFYGLSKRETSLLIACPPCQGFTRLSRKKHLSLNRLVKVFTDLLPEILPENIFFENVPGILSSSFFDYLLCKLEKIGFSYDYAVINALDFGVPQRRKRVILVATRNPDLKKSIRLPRSADNINVKTVRDAIYDLPPLKAGESHPEITNHECMNHSEEILNRIRKIPKNGGSLRHLPRHEWLKCHKRRNVGFYDVYGRLNWDQPANTITSGCTNPSKGRFIHPEQDRALSLREAARLQTFPDPWWTSSLFPPSHFDRQQLNRIPGLRHFVFLGNFAEKSRQIGNATPPLLAYHILRSVFGNRINMHTS